MELFCYKKNYGSVEFNSEDQIFHGKLLYIDGLVTYEAESISELCLEFQIAVDDYLKTIELST